MVFRFSSIFKGFSSVFHRFPPVFRWFWASEGLNPWVLARMVEAENARRRAFLTRYSAYLPNDLVSGLGALDVEHIKAIQGYLEAM